jgi:endonuclease G
MLMMIIFLIAMASKRRTPFGRSSLREPGQDERVIAWVVPNNTQPIRKNLDQYLVTVDELERITSEKIPVADYAKHDKPSSSWLIPHGCNKG